MDAAASQSTVGGAGRVRGGQGRPTARRTRRCWPAGEVQRSPLLAHPGGLLRAHAAGWAARWLQVEQGGRVTGHLSPSISSRKARYKAGEESMTVQKQSYMSHIRASDLSPTFRTVVDELQMRLPKMGRVLLNRGVRNEPGQAGQSTDGACDGHGERGRISGHETRHARNLAHDYARGS